MSSLHELTTVARYCAGCRQIWDDWRNTAPGGTTRRKNEFSTLMDIVCNTAQIPSVKKTYVLNLGAEGQFGWTEWEVEIEAGYFKNRNIVLEVFMELCSSIYHELRHAEQFTRIVQGLSLGRHSCSDLKLPDNPNVQQISQETHVKQDAVTWAVNHRDFYSPGFARTPRLSHCIFGSAPGWENWDPTVDAWLQRTYSKSQKTVAEIGQGDDVDNLPNLDGGPGTFNIVGGRRGAIKKQWYYRAEDELDAVACEKLVKQTLIRRFNNYIVNKRKGRRQAVAW